MWIWKMALTSHVIAPARWSVYSIPCCSPVARWSWWRASDEHQRAPAADPVQGRRLSSAANPLQQALGSEGREGGWRPAVDHHGLALAKWLLPAPIRPVVTKSRARGGDAGLNMAEHEPCVGMTSEWFTPVEIFDALGVTFDLDPAHPGAGAKHSRSASTRRSPRRCRRSRGADQGGHALLCQQ